MIVIYCHFPHCEIVGYGLLAIIIIMLVLTCSLAASFIHEKIKIKRQNQRFNKQIREDNNLMLTFRHQEKTDGS